MTTYLTNSKGVTLYKDPENVKKALRRRHSRLYCKGLLKYSESLALYKRDVMKPLTV